MNWFKKTLAGKQEFWPGSQYIEFSRKHDNRVALFSILSLKVSRWMAKQKSPPAIYAKVEQ